MLQLNFSDFFIVILSFWIAVITTDNMLSHAWILYTSLYITYITIALLYHVIINRNVRLTLVKYEIDCIEDN